MRASYSRLPAALLVLRQRVDEQSCVEERAHGQVLVRGGSCLLLVRRGAARCRILRHLVDGLRSPFCGPSALTRALPRRVPLPATRIARYRLLVALVVLVARLVPP